MTETSPVAGGDDRHYMSFARRGPFGFFSMAALTCSSDIGEASVDRMGDGPKEKATRESWASQVA